MFEFEYYAPTKIFFGAKKIENIGSIIKNYKYKKVLIHYGGKSAVKNGLIDKVTTALDKEGIEYILLGGVKPNPRISLALEGIKLCRENHVDHILAVGGGSVIDSAKAISFGALSDKPLWDFYLGKYPVQKSIPLGTILTIAAAGSETSAGTVMTNEDGWFKKSCGGECLRPLYAVMDPELTYTVSKYQTASGASDIFMHTLERWFTPEHPFRISDSLAIAILKIVIEYSRTCIDDPNNYEARANIMWAGSRSHVGLTGLGVAGDWSTHQMEHELGGLFDVAHGAGLTALWGHWARYVYQTNPKRFADLGRELFNIDGDNEQEVALETIITVEAFFKSLDMPNNLDELKINPTPEQIKEMSLKATNNGKTTIGGFRKLNANDIENIMLAANIK